jgi:hypothetical protein
VAEALPVLGVAGVVLLVLGRAAWRAWPTSRRGPARPDSDARSA